MDGEKGPELREGKPRILVVDDDESVAAMIRILLVQSLSAEVATCPDCAAAREALTPGGFDLVTLDYQLPDGDGLGLLEEINSAENGPPVILVTGHGDESIAAEAFKLGASGYVVKDRRLPTLLVEEAERALALRAALKALTASESRLKLITDNMVDSVSQTDREGRFVYLSPSHERSLGFSVEQLLGTRSSDLVHPDDIESLESALRDAIRTSEPSVALEYRYRTALGEYLWVESNTRLLYDGEGLYAGAVFASRNITERKNAEELVRAQRDLAMMMGELTEPDLIFESALAKILEMTGLDSGAVYAVEPATGALDMVCHTGLSDEFVEEVGHVDSEDPRVQVVMRGEVIFGIYTGMFPDSAGPGFKEQLKTLAVVPLRFEGEVVGCLNAASHTKSTFAPETREKVETLAVMLGQAIGRSRYVSALRESEARYRLLYDYMGEATYTYDLNLNLTGLNRRAGEVIGYPKEELLGRNVLELGILHPGDMGSAAADIQALFSGEAEVVRNRYRFISSDGTERVGDVTGACLRGAGGEIVGVTNVVIDMTEQVKAEEDLLKANEELRGYAQAVSHDLKGPIAAMQIAAETFVGAARAGCSEAELEELLDVIRNNSERANRHIEELLVLAQAGQKPVAVEEVDVGAVVKDVLADLSGLLKETCGKVVFAEDLGRVSANWTQVYQVLSNLISNALKHNDSEQPLVEVAHLGSDESGAHRYRVCDNGPGIQEGSESDIFQPFFKGGGAGGTGIGLSIVNRIISAYGGDISAYNDGGACFEFTLHDA